MSLNRPKILLFSHDPGGANTVIPLVKPLEASGFEVLLYGKGPALGKYEQAGLSGEVLTADTQDEINDFLTGQAPVCIVTGTSANDFTEKYLWQAAQRFSIPSLAILDQWINYGIRFSPYGIMQADLYELDKQHPYLPDAVGVMDDFAKVEMAAEGIPESRIVVTGQPYFETVRKQYGQKGKADLALLQERLGIRTEEWVLLFVSEPLEISYGSSEYLGYSEKTILRSVVDTLQALDSMFYRPLCLLVKIHPRENAQDVQAAFDSLQFKNIRVVLDFRTNPLEALALSDAVVGMSSMLLLEAALVGKPILSVQIGLKRDNPFVLSRQGQVIPIMSETALLSAFQSEFLGGKVEAGASFSTAKLEVVQNPVERILQWVFSATHTLTLPVQ